MTFFIISLVFARIIIRCMYDYKSGKTPLMESADVLSADEVSDALLQAGADVNLQDKVCKIYFNANSMNATSLLRFYIAL